MRVPAAIPRSIRSAKRIYRRSTFPLRRLSASIRMLPDFLIIGTQKGGTTSLYRYLTGHPRILSAVVKEVRFFNRDYHKGPLWYRAHFPTYIRKWAAGKLGAGHTLTGEATPYLFHPHAPKRVHSLVPDARLIVLLRNPVDRAYSHYQHHVTRGRESLSFEEAIDAEPSRIEGELEKMMQDERYRSLNYVGYAYLTRGIYVDHLRRWREHFDAHQFLVLESERFFSDTASVYKQVLRFLQLPETSLPQFTKLNIGRY
ncbi:MAG: sulfotransferase domain-containing protein, partial [Phycisphaerales bacterium]